MKFMRRVIFDFPAMAQEYQSKYTSDSGLKAVVIDVDAAKELCGEYSRNIETRSKYSVCAYDAAKLFVKRMFEAAVKDPEVKRVVFTAGGTASGKSTAIKIWRESSREVVIMDGTLSDKFAASSQVAKSLKHGKSVILIYVFTPIDVAMRQALDRAIRMGRVVSLETFAQTHLKSQQTILHLVDKFWDHPRFSIRLYSTTTQTEVEPKAINWYELLDAVIEQTKSSFEHEISARKLEGFAVPENIVSEFRRKGRKVGG